MTAVVSMIEDDPVGSQHGRNPFDDCIEVHESEMRSVNRPIVWLVRLKRRLDEMAIELTYGR